MSINESTEESLQSLIPKSVDRLFPSEFCRVSSSAYFFNFLCPVVPLSPFSSPLRLLSRLPVTYSFSLSSINMFQKTVPTQDVTNPVILPSFLLYVGCSFSPWLSVTLFDFWRSVQLASWRVICKKSYLYVPWSGAWILRERDHMTGLCLVKQAQRVPVSYGFQISWQRHRMVVGCQPYAPAAFTSRKCS